MPHHSRAHEEIGYGTLPVRRGELRKHLAQGETGRHPEGTKHQDQKSIIRGMFETAWEQRIQRTISAVRDILDGISGALREEGITVSSEKLLISYAKQYLEISSAELHTEIFRQKYLRGTGRDIMREISATTLKRIRERENIRTNSEITDDMIQNYWERVDQKAYAPYITPPRGTPKKKMYLEIIRFLIAREQNQENLQK